MLRAPPAPFGQRWLDCVWPLPPPFSLTWGCAGIEQGQQTRIVRVVGVVDDRVLQVGGRDGVPFGKSDALPA